MYLLCAPGSSSSLATLTAAVARQWEADADIASQLTQSSPDPVPLARPYDDPTVTSTTPPNRAALRWKLISNELINDAVVFAGLPHAPVSVRVPHRSLSQYARHKALLLLLLWLLLSSCVACLVCCCFLLIFGAKNDEKFIELIIKLRETRAFFPEKLTVRLNLALLLLLLLQLLLLQLLLL